MNICNALICWSVLLLAAFAFAGGSEAAKGPRKAAGPKTEAVSCNHLPTTAASSVPPPFERYMKLECLTNTGQGLAPPDDFIWLNIDGVSMGLSSTQEAENPATPGVPTFLFGWYVALNAVHPTDEERDALKKDLAPVIKRRFLRKAEVLKLEATTSNHEVKLIYLVVPNLSDSPPQWVVGLECNGTCYRQDKAPMIWDGHPKAHK